MARDWINVSGFVFRRHFPVGAEMVREEIPMLNCPLCNNNAGKWIDLCSEYEPHLLQCANSFVGTRVIQKACAKCGFIVKQITKEDMELWKNRRLKTAEYNPGVGSGG